MVCLPVPPRDGILGKMNKRQVQCGRILLYSLWYLAGGDKRQILRGVVSRPIEMSLLRIN